MSSHEEDWTHPNDWALQNPYTTVRTLIVDGHEHSRQIAWIEGAIWPPIGSAIELYEPNRDATVRAVRLQLSPNRSATVLIDVDDPRETGRTISRLPDGG